MIAANACVRHIAKNMSTKNDLVNIELVQWTLDCQM